jgi:hypothetical protein
MSVKRLILDSGVLDQDRIIGTGTVVLDSRAVLDLNIIAGTGYDASLGYNSNINLYDGANLVYDFAESTMGGMSATVQSLPTVQVIATAQLGAINSVAQTVVAHSVQGATNLGELLANANTLPTILPIFDAQLNALNSSATAVTTKSIQAQALLGLLTATIEALPEVKVIAEADLGSFTATAQASTPIPPEPTQQYGSRNGYYQVKNKKKQEPTVIQPTIINYEFEPLQPLIKTIFAIGKTDLFGLNVIAQSQIDFSTEQDDLDLLMIL